MLPQNTFANAKVFCGLIRFSFDYKYQEFDYNQMRISTELYKNLNLTK